MEFFVKDRLKGYRKEYEDNPKNQLVSLGSSIAIDELVGIGLSSAAGACMKNAACIAGLAVTAVAGVGIYYYNKPSSTPGLKTKEKQPDVAVTPPEGDHNNDQNDDDHRNDEDKHPTTPVGHKGKEIVTKPGSNSPATISGREYSGHALDRMQQRGLTPSMVESVIQNGIKSIGNLPNRIVHYDPVNKVKVITEGKNVITVMFRGK